MIDLIFNAIMIVGIVAVSVLVFLFAVVGVVHMTHRAYTLTIED
jgi:hypothetical protein